MKKLFIRLTILILVVLVGGGIFAYSQINRIVKGVVETQVPDILHVPVSLEEIDLSLLSGTGTLSGLIIDNPERFEAEHAFVLDSLDVKLDVASLRTDTLHITEIIIHGPEITVEGVRGQNLDQLIKNALSDAGPVHAPPQEDSPEPDEEKDVSKPGRKLVIDRLVLQNGQIHYLPLPGQYISIPLPDLEMTGIGDATGGSTTRDVLVQVLRQIDDTVIAAAPGAGKLAGEVVRRTAKRIDKTLDRQSEEWKNEIRGFLERRQEAKTHAIPAKGE